MDLGFSLKKTSALFLGLSLSAACFAQTYTTLPFTDDLSSGSLGAHWDVSDVGSVGVIAIRDASGGWPQYGTCNGASCANVGASAGNGLMLYNASVPGSGDNKIVMDLAMDLSGAGTVEFQFAVVDYGSGPSFDTIAIYLSDDGGSNFTYSTVLPLNQTPHNDGTWNEITYDVSSLISSAGLTQTSTVIFRMAAMLQQKGDYLTPKQWSTSNQSIYFDNFRGTELASLPVELLSFTGTKLNGGKLLNWETASEINNSHFDVQRSTDGVAWLTVGTVSGNGTSNEGFSYSFFDNFETNEPTYYRLKQIDFDDEFEYTNIVSFESESEELTIHIENNGTSPSIIFSGSNEEVNVKLYTIAGKLVFNTKTESGLDLMNLSNGTYMMFASSNGTVISEKISILK
jgi:hypothetical protein